MRALLLASAVAVCLVAAPTADSKPTSTHRCAKSSVSPNREFRVRYTGIEVTGPTCKWARTVLKELAYQRLIDREECGIPYAAGGLCDVEGYSCSTSRVGRHKARRGLCRNGTRVITYNESEDSRG